MLRDCRYCLSPFESTNAQKLYCSLSCANKSSRAKNQINKHCPACGNEYSTWKTRPNETCSFACSRKMLSLKAQERASAPFGLPIRDLLLHLYDEKKLGIKKIAKLLNVSDHVLWDWFHELKIPVRSRSEAVANQWVDNQERKQAAALVGYRVGRQSFLLNGSPSKSKAARKKISQAKRGKKNAMYGKIGSLHHAWKGGKITYRGAGWRSIRLLAIRRDGEKCQRCGSKKKLEVHHIIPYRETQDNSLENLVTLCASCHKAVEHRGEGWQLSLFG